MAAFLKENPFEIKAFEWVNLAGLMDFSFGILFIAYGLTKYVEQLGMPPRTLVWYVLAFAFAGALLLRNYVIKPRYGYMRKKNFFSPNTSIVRYVIIFFVVMFLSIVMKYCLEYFTDTTFRDVRHYSSIGSLIMLNIGLMVALPLATRAQRIRAVLYFPVLLGGLVAALRLSPSQGEIQAYFIGLTIPGLIIMGIGLIDFFRFLKQYPLEEATGLTL